MQDGRLHSLCDTNVSYHTTMLTIHKLNDMTGVSASTIVTRAYSPVTYGHLCYYVNGMLSMPGGISGLFNYFDVDASTMRYDQTSMMYGIEKYGLYTYDEFSSIIPVSEEVF